MLVCDQYRDPSTYFAFIVGNIAYPPPPPPQRPITKCVQDAEDMRDLLLTSGYPKENVITVLDKSHSDLLEHLAEFKEGVDGAEGCCVVLYYAGHGMEGLGGEVILLPVDADVTSNTSMWSECRRVGILHYMSAAYCNLYLSPFTGARKTCVSLSELQRQIAWALHSGTIVTLIDACRVGDDSIRMSRSPLVREYRTSRNPP